jgi:hypothetical protein
VKEHISGASTISERKKSKKKSEKKMNSNDLDDFFNGLPNNPLLQQAPDSNVVQLRVALLEERFDALESKVTQICNMLENQHNNNVNVASSSTTTTTTTSSNINDSPPAQQENQQVFSMVNKKKKCNKCSLQGDVRTEHLVSPTHLAAVRDRSGRPLYWCKGECGLTKSRNVDNINAVLLERPAHVAAKMSKTIADEDHGNRGAACVAARLCSKRPPRRRRSARRAMSRWRSVCRRRSSDSRPVSTTSTTILCCTRRCRSRPSLSRRSSRRRRSASQATRSTLTSRATRLASRTCR